MWAYTTDVRFWMVLLLASCTRQSPGASAPSGAVGSLPHAIVGKVAQGADLIGTVPPPLQVEWEDDHAHPLSEDRGKVVLVRWWTDRCGLCVNSAAAVARLKKTHGDSLVVRAIHHDKIAGRRLSMKEVAALAQETGWKWHNGRDPKWRALKRWWLDAGGRKFTSVTFLIDRKGKIRLVHTGGEFHPRDRAGCLYESPDRCAAEFKALDAMIAHLLRS